MGFYSSHIWANGAVITVERFSDDEVSVRVQDDKEKMLADFLMGEHEVVCLIASLSSVLAKKDETEFGEANIKKK